MVCLKLLNCPHPETFGSQLVQILCITDYIIYTGHGTIHSKTLNTLNAVSCVSIVSTSKYFGGKIVLHIDKDSDKHLNGDSSKNEVLMIVQKLTSHTKYVVHTKHGRKEDTRVGCYDLKPNVQIILSKVIKNTIILTHLLTPWSRILLEKLASSQLVKKFPAFYGN